MSKLACVRIYNMVVMAEIAKGLLESNGIKACISGAHPAQPHIEFAAGIRLWVNEEDKEKALDILKSHDKQSRQLNNMEQIKLPIKTKIAAWLMIIMGGLYLYSFLASTISFFFSRSPEPILIPLSPYEFFLRALQSFYPGVFGFFIPGLLLLFLKKRWIWFFVIVTFVIVSISEFMFSNSFGFFVFSLLPFFLLYFDRKNFFKIAP